MSAKDHNKLSIDSPDEADSKGDEKRIQEQIEQHLRGERSYHSLSKDAKARVPKGLFDYDNP